MISSQTTWKEKKNVMMLPVYSVVECTLGEENQVCEMWLKAVPI